MKKNLKINFKDKRGFILDIFANRPKDHCTLVSFNKKAVRGNHYHKKSTQYSFVVSGKLMLFHCRVNKDGKLLGKPKKTILSKYSLVKHKPFHAHAFKAIEKSIMLAFADGVRGGRNYEKDTFRLKKKLI